MPVPPEEIMPRKNFCPRPRSALGLVNFSKKLIKNTQTVRYCTDGKPLIPRRGVMAVQQSGDPRCGARWYRRRRDRPPGCGRWSAVTGSELAEFTLIRWLERGDGTASQEHAIRTREVLHGHAHVAGS